MSEKGEEHHYNDNVDGNREKKHKRKHKHSKYEDSQEYEKLIKEIEELK